MIHLFVWPFVIVALVQNNDTFRGVGIFVGIIASIAAIVMGVEIWPIQLIAVSIYWIVALLIAKFIRWIIRNRNSSE